MLPVEIKEIIYENYGKCVSISNGIIDVYVTVDVGPRIIRFGYTDGPNMLFNDLDRKMVNAGKEFDELYGELSKFTLYGGHRLWLSPESMPETYYPDNEPVVYAILPDGVSFTPPMQKHKKVQLGLEILMQPDAADIMVVHSVKNHSKDEYSMALWAITAVSPGGLSILPQNKVNAELLPNRTVALWPYADMNDPRVYWGKKYITLRHDTQNTNSFKLGTDNQTGWAAYVNDGNALIKRYVHNTEALYPDYGVSCELFENDRYAELETLSPLYEVTPGETIKHVENWSIFKAPVMPDPKDEAGIEEFINNLA